MNLAPSSVRTGHLRGFTLIELLVVIAIIGILSSVVLASLNTARNRGADASIKANLTQARAEAEIFYDTGNTYDAVCATTGNNVIGDSVRAADIAYDGSAPTYADGTAAIAGSGQCHDSTTAWAAQVSLKDTTQGTFCVDSTGKAGTTSTFLAINAVACP
jgi:type IV pilus assembly protein PilE